MNVPSENLKVPRSIIVCNRQRNVWIGESLYKAHGQANGSCTGCDFKAKFYCNGIPCAANERSDKKQVIFKLVQRVSKSKKYEVKLPPMSAERKAHKDPTHVCDTQAD